MENRLQDLSTLIDPQLMVASLVPEGIPLTLATRLGVMIRMAEELYGKRDRSYAFLGFEFTKANTRLRHMEATKELVIQLSVDSLHNPMEVYASLAHECIHLLSPLPNPQAGTTVLEEGLATFFAEVYMLFMHKWYQPIDAPRYRYAQALVGKLLEVDRQAIKKLRRKQPVLSLISKKLILKQYPDLPEEIATGLTEKFVYYDEQIAMTFPDRESTLAVSDVEKAFLHT